MPADPDSTTPGLRLLELLELMAGLGRPQSLAELQARPEIAWPKPTLHRMLQQLESAGLLQREPDGRRYALGGRALRMAEAMLAGSAQQGVRHAVLRSLVNDIGESCNLTALSGADVIYLDRVEAAFPLRMELRAGTRVPLHASASGKLFLAFMPARQRRQLLQGLTLSRHTATTLASAAALETELERIRREGYAVDDQEFVEGLNCVAVPVREPGAGEQQPVRCAVALQAPAARLPLAQALGLVPRLREAAAALARSL
ncbi:IclR family transcriptional regulator [Roseateles violae]|uniref:IclR family transcriptional regulator n=1 Tax=Roseateles violae TaxID=3058042 RepID=A0ABT8DNI4_9BURK|nr:IclR family transcriptional regulator [Pelomonas sp. PFR6]MDN3919551.1 IclR family transcriptional regulator [Pelomonas sp. PFR6]